MLSNERFALERRAYYESIGLVVDATNGEFCHSPVPERYGDKGYYLLHNDHQHQGLLQSKDIGECCFFLGDAKKWLIECDPIPENYFELWDIYEEFASLHTLKLHEEKDENGKSLHAVKTSEKLHEEKDENGKSLHTLKLHEEKDELGRSLHTLRMLEKVHAEKNEEGKSVAAMKAGRAAALKHERMVELIRISDREVFIFESIKFAAEILGINRRKISDVCNGKQRQTGGHTARYLD